MLHFKYTRAKHLESILGKGQFAFPLFHQLNDPFESSIESTLAYLRADLQSISYFEQQPMVWMRMGGIKFDAINPAFDDAEPKRQHNAEVRSHNELLKGLLQHLSWCRDNLGICSLTAVPDDVVMWAHYAANGTGACIGLDLSQLECPSLATDACLVGHEELLRPLPITYQPQRPKFERRSKLDYVRSAFFTKFERWEYERETRLLRPVSACIASVPVPLFAVPRSCIREVNLGAASDDSLLRKVKGLVADLPSIVIRKVKVATNEYQFQFETVHTAPGQGPDGPT